ncbi:ATP cone domain-containing protein [Flavihumibacter stibioxidans]|uniref:ATPase n=1 Tax=Flavihumibacter stibioxidans TaxID=1834163 RepID=A0ABR7M967_9BACT|nr:ATP cone domain-containing protein [Flavihumibacter stibioxidans]MBC6491566.1 ATPase [Flavihumibacter stibioxidans]
MPEKKIFVTKMSGEMAEFDEQKLRNSLMRSGAAEKEVETIIDQVNASLFEGMSTRAIYKIAFSLLRKKSRPAASRYKLKKAIFELGPTGFPFEKYIGELMKFQGYKISVGNIIAGNCVNHEVDILAELEDSYFMVECKFHHEQGQFCSVKIPLYIQARFTDIIANWLKQTGDGEKKHRGGLVTNTRFSADALAYGECMGLLMISWDYPANNSLRHNIDKYKLYPVTSLMSITNHEKKSLLEKGIILSKSIIGQEQILTELNISEERISRIIREAKILCE